MRTDLYTPLPMVVVVVVAAAVVVVVGGAVYAKNVAAALNKMFTALINK